VDLRNDIAIDNMTDQQQESPAFNVAMLLTAQGLVAVIAVIVLYFWQMLGPGCPDDQCFVIWALNTVARWTLILLFIGTLTATIILRSTGRPSVRVPLIGAIIGVAVAVLSVALVWFLPGGVGAL
jgi:hypothetical protein